MFRQIAGFELRYHVRSPLFWVTTLIFALLTFGSIASDNVRIGGIAGNVKKNSPFAVGVTLQTMSIFAVFIMAAFVANVVIRDDETGYGQIVHSTRVSRFDYLFGRFTGAFAAGCASFVGVPLGLLLGSFMPWIDPETLGPFRPGDYLYAYFAVALPTLVVMAAFCFALATITRSMLGTYVGARRAADDVFRVRRVLFAPRIRAHRGAARSVRRGGVWLRDEVLDGRRAQHAAAGDCRRDPVEPRHLAQCGLRVPGRRLVALSSRTKGRQEIQEAGSRAGVAARSRSGKQQAAGGTASRCRGRACPAAGRWRAST